MCKFFQFWIVTICKTFLKYQKCSWHFWNIKKWNSISHRSLYANYLTIYEKLLTRCFFSKTQSLAFWHFKKKIFFCRRKNYSKSQELINFCFLVVNWKFLRGVIRMDFVVNSRNEKIELFFCFSIKKYENPIECSFIHEMMIINAKILNYLDLNKRLFWNFASWKFSIFLRVILFRKKIKMLSIFPYL